MAKDTKAEPKEFTLTVDEFLGEMNVSEAETKAAFKSLMEQEKITGRKPRHEWARLLLLFRSQPTALSWGEWLSQHTGGN